MNFPKTYKETGRNITNSKNLEVNQKLRLKELAEKIHKTTSEIFQINKFSYIPQIIKGSIFASMLSAAIICNPGESKAEPEIRNSTALGRTTIRIATINRSEAILNIMRICTQFESWDDLAFRSSTFIETWGRRGYTQDRDGDGIAEHCIEFESSAQIMNFRLGQSADIVLRSADNFNQISIRDQNGRTNGWGQGRGGTIIDFYPQIPNPYSPITFIPNIHGSIVGDNDDVNCGEETEGDICNSEVYWNRNKNYQAIPAEGYLFSHFTGCNVANNDLCSVDGDSRLKDNEGNFIPIEAHFTEVPPILWNITVNISEGEESLGEITGNNLNCTGNQCITSVVEGELYNLLIKPIESYEAIVTGCDKNILNEDGSIGCQITPTSDKYINVDYEEIYYPTYTANITQNELAEIFSIDNNTISCSGENPDCSEVFDQVTELKLEAKPFDSTKEYTIEWSDMPECKNNYICIYQIDQNIKNIHINLTPIEKKFNIVLYMTNILAVTKSLRANN